MSQQEQLDREYINNLSISLLADSLGLGPEPSDVFNNNNRRTKYTHLERCLTAQYFFDHLYSKDSFDDKQQLLTRLQQLLPPSANCSSIRRNENILHRLRNLRDRHTRTCAQLLDLEKLDKFMLIKILNSYLKEKVSNPTTHSLPDSKKYSNIKDELLITEICYREILGEGFVRRHWHTTGQSPALKQKLDTLRPWFQQWVDSLYGQGIIILKDPNRNVNVEQLSKRCRGGPDRPKYIKRTPAPNSVYGLAPVEARPASTALPYNLGDIPADTSCLDTYNLYCYMNPQQHQQSQLLPWDIMNNLKLPTTSQNGTLLNGSSTAHCDDAGGVTNGAANSASLSPLSSMITSLLWGNNDAIAANDNHAATPCTADPNQVPLDIDSILQMLSSSTTALDNAA
ncbi:hypothetical protein EV182_004758, partial [Spiromyces aspiralis]